MTRICQNNQCRKSILQPFYYCESCHDKGFRLDLETYRKVFESEVKVKEALTDKPTIFREKEGIF